MLFIFVSIINIFLQLTTKFYEWKQYYLTTYFKIGLFCRNCRSSIYLNKQTTYKSHFQDLIFESPSVFQRTIHFIMNIKMLPMKAKLTALVNRLLINWFYYLMGKPFILLLSVVVLL